MASEQLRRRWTTRLKMKYVVIAKTTPRLQIKKGPFVDSDRPM